MSDPAAHAPTVLLVSLHFPPGAASGAFRILGFTRHLPGYGWNPVVVTCDSVPFEPVDAALAADIPAEAIVRYVRYPRNAVADLGRRLLVDSGMTDGHWVWSRAARRACAEAIRAYRPAVVLTSGPPHSVHLVGAWIKDRYRIPWISDFRDPWTVHGPLAPIGKRIRRRVFEHSDHIIVNAPGALDKLSHEFPGVAPRVSMLPNGFDPPTADLVRVPRAPSDPVTIVHAGELYAGRDPRPLLDALVVAEAKAPEIVWSLRFIGRSGDSVAVVAAEVAKRHLRSVVRFEPQLPYSEAKTQMRGADVLLLLDGPGRRIGVPAKAYEYMGTGRPILALAEPGSDTEWALRNGGTPFRAASPSDVDGIAAALLGTTEMAAAGTATIPLAASPFTRHTLASQLGQTLDRVASRAGS